MDISLAEVHWIAAKIKYTKKTFGSTWPSHILFPTKVMVSWNCTTDCNCTSAYWWFMTSILNFQTKAFYSLSKETKITWKERLGEGSKLLHKSVQKIVSFLPFLEQSWQLVPQSCCCAAYKTYKSHMQWHQHLSLAWHQSHVEVMNYGTHLGRWNMAQILILHSTWYCHRPGKKIVICIRNDSSLKEWLFMK